MTENKRFRMETIGDIMLPFIVDNSTAKKKSDTTTTYHTYETHRKEKCLELVDLLNDFSEENEQLKQQSDNKQKHIVTLENKIVRMRKAIHKLEWLSTHRNADLQRENKQLKQEVTHWKKILDNHQQIVAKTLREQYHWLKNEDKIQNNDKTVALLELESISERLGIDLI